MRFDIKQYKTPVAVLLILFMIVTQVFADSYTDAIDKCKKEET